MEDKEKSDEPQEVDSCVKGMSRKEFLRALVKKSVAAGALFAAVSAVEQFELPAAYAANATA